MKWLQLIMQLFPTVLQMIVAVEAALQGAPGAVKKAVVVDTLTGGAAGNTLSADHLAALPGLVDSIVTTLNKVGVFPPATGAPKP